jgi:transposase
MPPAYGKPYVKRQKNDAADAEAICEAGHPGKHAVLVEAKTWLTALLARHPTKVAALALANKMARMAWAKVSATRNPSRSRRKRDRADDPA